MFLFLFSELPFLQGRQYKIQSKFSLGALTRSWGKWYFYNNVMKPRFALDAAMPRWDDNHNCDCSWEINCMSDQECKTPKFCFMSQCCGTHCIPDNGQNGDSSNDDDKHSKEDYKNDKENLKEEDKDGKEDNKDEDKISKEDQKEEDKNSKVFQNEEGKDSKENQKEDKDIKEPET